MANLVVLRVNPFHFVMSDHLHAPNHEEPYSHRSAVGHGRPIEFNMRGVTLPKKNADLMRNPQSAH
jgi:hypothetical protein